MANADHLERLLQGVDAWNAWRAEEPSVKPDLFNANLSGAHLFRADLSAANLVWANLSAADLSAADLSAAHLFRANLSGVTLVEANLIDANFVDANFIVANLREANLSGADLSRANLIEADLRAADLREANLRKANLREANLRHAYLRGANVSGADLSDASLRWTDFGGADLSDANLRCANLLEANLSGADLSGANLSRAKLSRANLSGADFRQVSLVKTDLSGADLTGCRIYGMSAWDLNLEGAKQNNLIITPEGQADITVDNIEVAQFIYLLLHNQKIRNVINTITSKAVLIIGRFTPERKQVLDTMRDELRKRDLLPIIFDFSIPESRDVTETVKVLAGLARFVIADITDATEVRVELQKIIPDFPSLPVQPILLRGQPEFISMRHLKNFPWLLPTFEYDSQEHLLVSLYQEVIGPAEAKALELRGGPG